ncbi:MAG: T9SS-dependent M6-like inactivated metalloprotease [Melioribacteraceae bacterium]
MKKLFLALIIGLGSLPAGQAGISAQSFVEKVIHNPSPVLKNFSSADTLKILAVMVDFQADKYDATIGTGKFGSNYTQDYGDTILDPLPHDVNYFSDHLLFAKNYFNKVSHGKLNINYKVLSDIITVSQTMRNYVQDYQSNDLTPLANFAKEVWTIADSKFSNIKFSDYDLFIIFHAGVSSGLDLGIYSIDRNMPSLYMGQNTFQKIFGNQFTGFPTKSGKISNSIILPETESREVTAIDNSIILQQITINGAIVANIASYLGLPDLFNTETGISAIGRFGLMDGQAIVANNGMFPPEPSPWEKMYLGWETPTTISSIADKKISIAARLTASQNDTTLLKVPLNSSEYFLIENRQQDANKDNVKVTYRKGGQNFTTTIQPDTNGLYTILPEKIHGGVVIDVDEYDAAVPGNGLVIWHIDDRIIDANIGSNSINANANQRGVYVEEADGIMDIGKQFNSIFGTSIGEGSYQDFWYSGNDSKLYKNVFGPDTKPNTKTNNGANSFITMENFSKVSNKMSFNLNYSSGNIKPVSVTNLKLSTGQKYLTSLLASGQALICVTDNLNTYRYDINGVLKSTIPNFSNMIPASFDYNQVGTQSNVLKLSGTTAADYSFSSNVSAPLVIDQAGDNAKIYAGTSDGRVYSSNPLGDVLKFIPFVFKEVVTKQSEAVKQISASPNYFSLITQNYFSDANGTVIKLANPARKLINSIDTGSKPFSIVLTEKNEFYIIAGGKIINRFTINSQNDITDFSLADLYGDGQNYILIPNGQNLEAYNMNGNFAPNFPFTISGNESFTGAPLALDLNNNGVTSVIAYTQTGTIYAYNPVSGKIADGFPITTGIQFLLNPVLLKEELPTMGPLPIYKPYLAVIDQTDKLYVWNLSPVQGKSYWSGMFGDAMNTSFVSAPSSSNKATEFFPTEKAYNWPNPVYGGSTNIRFHTSEDADVNIKIVDLAGELVAELNGHANGGLDNEIIWDVSKVQSGIYFARLEVKGVSGNSANKIIKIAVIK